jgi:hypothetical protein
VLGRATLEQEQATAARRLTDGGGFVVVGRGRFGLCHGRPPSRA